MDVAKTGKAVGKFVKHGGEWCVRYPEEYASAGDWVTVSCRRGFKRVRLVAKAGTDLFWLKDPERWAKAEEARIQFLEMPWGF